MIRPLDPGLAGSYRVSVVSGTLAAALAAGAVVFSAQWRSTTKEAVIHRFRTSFMPLTPFTAATLTDHTSFDLFVGRSFTAAHTGGTALTLTKNQMRKSMPASAFTDMRVATTAALGGAAGLVLDPHPIAQTLRKGNRVNPAAATEETLPPTDFGNGLDFSTVTDGEHPLVLSADEGIVLVNRTVWPAAGTGIVKVELIWSEITSY